MSIINLSINLDKIDKFEYLINDDLLKANNVEIIYFGNKKNNGYR